MTPRTFGIVGYGHFGELLASSFRAFGDVLVTDPATTAGAELPPGVRVASLAETAAADVVVIAVPFRAFEAVLTELRDLLAPTTVVMDVVSTKALATALLQDVLGEHPNILSTHPLFGPPSMDSVAGQRLVVTYERGEQAKAFRRFLEDELRLTTIDVSAEEHDRQMAYMQALPFFIARALVELDIPQLARESSLSIPSFEKLASIASIEQHHSQGMFETSQTSNPYAQQARRDLLEVLRRIDAELDREP